MTVIWFSCFTSLKLSLLSRSSSTSFIMFFNPRCVWGAPSFSIIIFSSIRSMKLSFSTSYLQNQIENWFVKRKITLSTMCMLCHFQALQIVLVVQPNIMMVTGI